MSSPKVRPTPPPAGPALVRPAVGVLLLTMASADLGCATKAIPPMVAPPMVDPSDPPMDNPGDPPMADPDLDPQDGPVEPPEDGAGDPTPAPDQEGTTPDPPMPAPG